MALVSRFAFVICFAVLPALLFAAAPPTKPANVSADHARNMARSRELFAAKVRPLLVNNCLKCHGGAKTRAEDCRLSRRGARG